MAVYLTNSFEQGTSGTTISTSNTGGGNDNAFNVVTIGASAGLIFSNAEAAHGSLSAKFTEPSAATTCYVEWTTSLTGSSIGQVWFRAYCYFTAFTATVRVIEALSGSTLCGAIAVNTAGKVLTLNEAGTTQTTSTLTLPAGAWFRLEGYVIGSATAGQVQVQIFTTSADEISPDETDTSGAAINTTGTVSNIRFGNPSDGTSWSFYLDDLGASDTAYLGPSQITGGSGIAALTLAASAAGSSKRTGSPSAVMNLAASAAGSSHRTGSPPAALTLAATAAGTPVFAGAVPAGSSPTVTPASTLSPTVG